MQKLASIILDLDTYFIATYRQVVKIEKNLYTRIIKQNKLN